MINRLYRALLISGLFLAFTLPAQARQLDVVASIKPVHSLVQSVMGSRGEVTLLMDSSLDPHIFSMRPSHIRKVVNADVLFYVDSKLETFLTGIIDNDQQKVKSVALAKARDLKLLPYRTSKIWFTEETEDHTGHDHEEMDLHIWLDPENAIQMVRMIEETLSALDPDHRVTYIRNSKLVIKRLYELKDRLRQDLRPFREKPIIIYHDAFQYFEKAFSLYSVGAIQLNSDSPPSASHLKALKQIAKEKHVTCVLGTPGSHPRIATVVMGDTSANYGVVDPLGVYLEPGPSLYMELIEEIALTIEECQGGDHEIFDINPGMPAKKVPPAPDLQ
ncbi:zinc ABC transporter substrate-binding protein [Emcibacter sp.]|uniref:zinc ABC transporter substrate-binding protein n=1 Tax=Emcibacter sp. TaxID=1979954 RepID=UPI002AA7DDE6|nr:zinc ABC transporter substrate-binding protein [Emcibacter sp.]